ncbi:hypothetical protein SNOG_07994 [Parastagonospora nodorum SN15]|uniref:Uncharacterized protein n=1 Tax=Phaeosphaeria nodorum (strain SN15 / ATCC MYA-4574 / FGSC 10173) TaxID=321614 RepID=Q0UJS0_PHANO|nr:hypothetical protein SNOG_07994 [Parastagonospora nodorum SN15]EAT84270.1 hypothetical protein SNOG_07994 [Parastagonospora nodorum SN15]
MTLKKMTTNIGSVTVCRTCHRYEQCNSDASSFESIMNNDKKSS